MQSVAIIGGSGKVATYLAPMLIKAGYRVTAIGRGSTKPSVPDRAWEDVQSVRLDRSAPDFPQRLAQLKADIVVDMICFKLEDMHLAAAALEGSASHYLVCGSAWMHGNSAVVPVREEECREPLEEYGRQKSLMDDKIHELFLQKDFPGTAVHPGHIVCPGDIPINPQGFKSLSAFELLREGKPLYLPNFGMETLHHVHAADVAGVFLAAIRAGRASFGEGFHAVSPRAVTLRGYAREAASWYGKEADLRFEPFDQWKERFQPSEADATLTHILHSPSCSMEKAKEKLGFSPRYSSFDAIRECLASFGL